MTPGNCSLPMDTRSPTPQLAMPTIKTVKAAINMNGTLTSFFWHAGPAQRIVFFVPLSFSRTVVVPQRQAKHVTDLDESPSRLDVYFS